MAKKIESGSGPLLNRKQIQSVLTPVIILLIMLLFTGCAVNRATGRRQFNIISESREISIGRDADPSITAQMGYYPDSSLQQYVRNLGLAMAAKSERPTLPWSFKILDDPIVNAFALPGGYIYVTRGILAHLNNEAELTGVVGHEIGHVTGKHSVEQMSQATLAQLGLGLSVAIQPKLEKYAQVASTGLGLLLLKYGRDDEKEADALGLRYMQTTNHDPREMIDVMAMLDGITQAAGGSPVPEWLSTHPDPGNRKQLIQSYVDTISHSLSGVEVGRDTYLNRIDGIVFGVNPRHGYFKENIFFHPDLEFRFDFPAGWQHANLTSTVYGVGPNQDVIIQITMAQGQSASAAANSFFSQEGMQATQIQSGNVNGLPAVWADFQAPADGGGYLLGTAYFIEFGGAVYQVLGYGTESGWAQNRTVVTPSLTSFRKLTDPAVIAVQPWRMYVIATDGTATLSQLYAKRGSPVSLDAIELLNRIGRSDNIPSGSKIKWIEGKPLP